MTLEDLGYKRNREEENQIKKNYYKEINIIVYEIDEHKIPKDELKYCGRTILIINEGAKCYDSEFMESECLSFDEMKAILEMKEKGKFKNIISEKK